MSYSFAQLSIFWGCLFFPLQWGWTALMAAARKNRAEIVKLLIERGASIEMEMTVRSIHTFCAIYMVWCLQDAKKLTGERALHIACYMGSYSVVQVLIQHGANLDATNKVAHKLKVTPGYKDTHSIKYKWIRPCTPASLYTYLVQDTWLSVTRAKKPSLLQWLNMLGHWWPGLHGAWWLWVPARKLEVPARKL